jgi:hypothetical protein
VAGCTWTGCPAALSLAQAANHRVCCAVGLRLRLAVIAVTAPFLNATSLALGGVLR